MSILILLTFLFSSVFSQILDTICASIECEPEETLVSVCIKVDRFPSETSWLLIDQDMSMISSNNFDRTTPTLSIQSAAFCVSGEQTLQFILRDTGGNGLCCEYGLGAYAVYLDYQIAVSGNKFTSSITHQLQIPDKSCLSPRVLQIRTSSDAGGIQWTLAGQLYSGDETQENIEICTSAFTWVFALNDTIGDGIGPITGSNVVFELDTIARFSASSIPSGYKAQLLFTESGLTVRPCHEFVFEYENSDTFAEWFINVGSNTGTSSSYYGNSFDNSLEKSIFLCEDDFVISVTYKAEDNRAFAIKWDGEVKLTSDETYTSVSVQATITRGELVFASDCDDFSVTVYADEYPYETSWALYDVTELWEIFLAQSKNIDADCTDFKSFYSLESFRETCASNGFNCDAPQTFPDNGIYYAFCFDFICADVASFPSNEIYAEACLSNCSNPDEFGDPFVYQRMCFTGSLPECGDQSSFSSFREFSITCDSHTYECGGGTWPSIELSRAVCESSDYALDCSSSSTFPTYEYFLIKCYRLTNTTCQLSNFPVEQDYFFYCEGYTYNCTDITSFPNLETYSEACGETKDIIALYKQFRALAVESVTRNPLRYIKRDSTSTVNLNLSSNYVLCSGMFLFSLFDDYEDGICCDFGSGSAQLGYGFSNPINITGDFEKSIHVVFETLGLKMTTKDSISELGASETTKKRDRSWVAIPIIGYSLVGSLLLVIFVQYFGGKKLATGQSGTTLKVGDIVEASVHGADPV